MRTLKSGNEYVLIKPYSHRAAREGFKTMGALIASDAVGFANDLIEELKKQGD